MGSYVHSAYQLNSEDSMVRIGQDLPLLDVQSTRSLSGVDSITFTISPENPRLLNSNGDLILKERKTLVLVEWLTNGGNTMILNGAIVNNVVYNDDQTASVECVCHLGLMIDEPWPFLDEPWMFINTYPAALFGFLIDKFQVKNEWPNFLRTEDDFPYSDTIGEPWGTDEDKSEGPYEVSFNNTESFFDRLTELAELGDFDFYTDWAYDSEGYPRATVRCIPDDTNVFKNRRLELGIHFASLPERSTDPLYSNQVYVIGAGKGKKKIKVVSTNSPDGRIPKSRVVRRPTVTSRKRARKIANKLAQRFSQNLFTQGSEIQLADDPSNPLRYLDLAEVLVIAGTHGKGMGQNYEEEVRITSISLYPDTETASIAVTKPIYNIVPT